MRPAAALSAVTIAMVTAFGVSGCGSDEPPPPPVSERAQSTTPPSPAAAPLPPPEDLTAVLRQLADTSIPPERKLALVQYATPDDQAALGNFGQALSDSGFRDLTIDAADLAWAPTPGNVDATVRIAPADDPARAFTFPMEFSPLRDGWQLTRQTADQLLVLGSTPTPTPPR
jgi:hypothetical protein